MTDEELPAMEGNPHADITVGEPEPAAPAAAADPIKIGTKEFASAAEAAEYMSGLEAEKAKAVAYKEGMKDSLGMKPEVVDTGKPNDKDFIKDLEDNFFADPAQTLNNSKKEAVEEAVKIMEQRQAAGAERENLWRNFYSKNPDLSGESTRSVFEEFVVALSQKEEYKAMPMVEGMAKAAELFKAAMGKNEKVLPSGGAQVTGVSSGSIGQVVEDKEDSTVDFLTQVRQAQDKKARL